MNASLKVSEIWTYPIKSLAGIRTPRAMVKPKGLLHDRRFMLIDDTATALTQRTHPKMALFRVSLEGDNCVVSLNGDSIRVPLYPEDRSIAVQSVVWDDVVSTIEVNPAWSQWFTERLDVSCRLVFFPEESLRPVERAFQVDNDQVSLADAYPLLLLGQSSVDDLNKRLSRPVTMKRFRPNIVFTGGKPFDEDSWSVFRIGENVFKAVKPCARCALPTVDPETGATGPEPLRTLASFRKTGNKVLFGQNVLVVNAKEIAENDIILIDSYRRAHE